MPTLSLLNLFLFVRIGFVVGVVWSHLSYYRTCLNLDSIPLKLRLFSVDPRYCLNGRAHSHHLYYARNQFEPRVGSQNILYNLGTEACRVLMNHTNYNNAYQTIGHKTVLILRNEALRSILIGKVHHKLNTRSEENPEWAAKIDRCLQNIRASAQNNDKECSMENMLCEINQLQSQCHCNHLAKLLSSQPGPLSRHSIVAGALHSGLVFERYLQRLQKGDKEINRESTEPDSWPFAPYVGGCGIFAVSEYVGCPLSDYFNDDISIRIKIALKVLDVAVRLDEETVTADLGKIMLYNRDFHLKNLALGPDGRVYITDTDEISILSNTADLLEDNEWKCFSGIMQNVYDVLANVLLDKSLESTDNGEAFGGFLSGIQEAKKALNLEGHPTTPTQTTWINMASIERVIHLNEVIDSLNETLYALYGCNSYLRWILTILCALIWLPKLFKDIKRLRWKTRVFRLPLST